MNRFLCVDFIFRFALTLFILHGAVNAQEYYKFTGLLHQYPIAMELVVSPDNKISGQYWYQRTGVPISIEGSRSKFNTITLNERDAQQKKLMAVFSGSIHQNQFEGQWKSANKTLSFSLQQDSSLFINYRTIKQQNCDYALAVKSTKAPQDLGYQDTLCTQMELQYIHLQGKGPAPQIINHRIERALLNFAPGECTPKNLKELLNCTKSAAPLNLQEPNTGFEWTANIASFMYDETIISFNLVSSVYYFGAAHPMSALESHNYNSLTGQRILLNSVFKDVTYKPLIALAEQCFIKENGREGWNYEPGAFYLPENFLLKPQGIEFQFQPYEIGPYAMGAPVFTITYKSLAPYLNHPQIPKQWLQRN